ncbi:choline/carnitine O-acyltransferase [Ascoidea rubescens DSM 1968]|uniref:CoA-dependent acyltransferase n=1 Tax=Ascoidea rubescens DSM 1968 TaxID=1344418 RepID=A0A1D2VL25_9ASCO|nr:CoA-dependent acyltransferase [Ascoidea rubescens DSM 1968]ODV62311.1 CoA-dependent acyltransferase [Ascoidea rubescens DSM 1968]
MTASIPERVLPKLTIPPLEHSIEAFLSALKPLQSPENYLSSVETLSNFKENEIINILQQHLEKYSSDLNTKNYLDLFSNVRNHNATNIYSEYRGKILPRNPYFILEADPKSKFSIFPPTQTERASVLVSSALKFIVSLRKGKIPNDVTPKSGNPLSTRSYYNLFGTTRFPSNRGHGINIKQDQKSKHLVILSNTQFWILQVLDDDNNIIFKENELEIFFQKIVYDAQNFNTLDPTKVAIASISSTNRTSWASARRLLNNNETNSKNLNSIDTALFVLNLDMDESYLKDDNFPSSIAHGYSKISQGFQVGSGISRWYDKLQIIVAKNSKTCVMWEPTSCDGTTVLRFVSDIYTDTILRLAIKINNNSRFSLWLDDIKYVSNDYKKPGLLKLKWDSSDIQLLKEIHLSETRLGDMLCRYEHKYKNFTKHVGNNLFTQKYNLNPDSLVQLAIQIAFYALYGKTPSTFESVSTRRFENGRSEMCSIQNDLILNISQNFISNVSTIQRWSLIQKGIEEINRLKSASMHGRGFEKHFKALKLAYIMRNYINDLHKDVSNLPQIPEIENLKDIEQKIPLLFNEKGLYELIFEPEILAVNCGNPSLKFFSVTPAHPNGFGIGYIIKEDLISLTICSQFRQNERFIHTLQWVFNEIYFLWKNVGKLKNHASLVSAEEMLRTISMATGDSNNDSTFSMNRSESLAVNNDPEYSLGGYGFFDVDDLQFRNQSTEASTKISRNASYAQNLTSLQNSNHFNHLRKQLHSRLSDGFENRLSGLNQNDFSENEPVGELQTKQFVLDKQLKLSIGNSIALRED